MRRPRRRRALQLLDEVGIGAERRLQLRKFSKGMLQRVGIAQALINEPEVVFLDEPMSGLDPLGRREIRELILRLRDRGCTVFFSSHVLSDAEALCSRVAILVGGRLAAQGSLSELLARRVRGWEIVVAGVGDGRPRASRGRRRRRTRAAARRRPLLARPCPRCRRSRCCPRCSRRACRSSSVNPIRDTLEDLFVQKVAESPVARGLEVPAAVRVIRLVAVNVFKESVRDKVLYNLVAFAVLLMARTYLLGQLTAGQDIKIIKDLGLAAISLFGLMIAVFIGIGLVWKEVDKRSIYGVLSKPVRRHEFVLGKFFGLLLTLAVNLLVMTVAFYAVLALNAWHGFAGDACRHGDAGRGSGDAQGHPADRHRARAGHRDRPLLLHLLEPVSVGRADRRPVGDRPLQRRPSATSATSSTPGGGVADARALLSAPELRRVRHQVAGHLGRTCRRPRSRASPCCMGASTWRWS